MSLVGTVGSTTGNEWVLNTGGTATPYVHYFQPPLTGDSEWQQIYGPKEGTGMKVYHWVGVKRDKSNETVDVVGYGFVAASSRDQALVAATCDDMLGDVPRDQLRVMIIGDGVVVPE